MEKQIKGHKEALINYEKEINSLKKANMELKWKTTNSFKKINFFFKKSHIAKENAHLKDTNLKLENEMKKTHNELKVH